VPPGMAFECLAEPGRQLGVIGFRQNAAGHVAAGARRDEATPAPMNYSVVVPTLNEVESCWLVATAFIFGLTRDLFGKSAAIRATLLMAVMPFFYAIGLSMTPDTPLVACWAAALFFLTRLLVFGDRRAWLGLGVAFGFGLLSKYSIVLLAFAATTFLLVDRPARRWLRRPDGRRECAAAAELGDRHARGIYGRLRGGRGGVGRVQ
jgi:hypothetical protein